MRITENIYDNNEYYTDELKERAEAALKYGSWITEARKLLKSLKEQAPNLRRLFLSEDEKKENSDAVASFDDRMNKMTAATFNNVEKYQLFSWKELFDSGECDGDTRDNR